MRPAILVVGSVTIDQIADSSRLGGVVTYAGATFARLGARVAAAYRAPDDLPWIASRLRALGIAPMQQPSQHLTRFVHSVSQDDRTLRVTETAPPISVSAQALDQVRDGHLHLGPLHPQDLDAAWYCTHAARTVSIDLQGLVRGIDDDGLVVTRVSPALSAALGAATFVKTSEEELAAVLAHTRCDASDLLAGRGELVVTGGRRGGYVLTADGERIDYEAAAADGDLDPTGAGDVFFACWLMERVHRGAGPREACVRAARAAALHVTGQWIGRQQLSESGSTL